MALFTTATTCHNGCHGYKHHLPGFMPPKPLLRIPTGLGISVKVPNGLLHLLHLEVRVSRSVCSRLFISSDFIRFPKTQDKFPRLAKGKWEMVWNDQDWCWQLRRGRRLNLQHTKIYKQPFRFLGGDRGAGQILNQASTFLGAGSLGPGIDRKAGENSETGSSLL